MKDCGPDSPFPTFREKLAVNLWRCPFFSERQLLARERRNKQTMGQKREQTIEVEFTEADKECLVRLVKELAAKGFGRVQLNATAVRQHRLQELPGREW